jgi:excisionase family DNA binding protein
MSNTSLLASCQHGRRVDLKVDEVAEGLRVGRGTVYRMMASGILPVVRHGRAVRVPVGALLRWIERRTEEQEPR